MDDIPAGPASAAPRRPLLSVVVPVRNGGRDFERCLRRLRASLLTDHELIVVDDGSTDDSAASALAVGAIVVRIPAPRGPAAARNLGAQAARSALVFFLDADVAVHPETLGRALARFEADPALTALFGSYDDTPAAPGMVSQYRNLLHHFVHQQGAFRDGIRPAHTFWTGCGMIRREAFLEFGGFDPRLYPRPAIEDIELGYRLTRAGHRIVLARDVLATHLKRWTLLEMVRTDIFRRGVPWMLLIKRSGTVETDLNVKAGQKACVAVTGLTLLAALFCAVSPWACGGVAMGLAAIVLSNRDFFRFLVRRKGLAFASAALPLHLLYYCSCGCAVLLAEVYWRTHTNADDAAQSSPQERTDPGTASIPEPAFWRWARRLSRRSARSGR
jgi:cellulose synthase/poly-beta-1,6-N-acetylglucosamine synthase-like glycosyltransferase